MSGQIQHLLGLIVVCLVAVGALLLLVRQGGGGRSRGLLLGYPASLFPEQELTASGPLSELAATQARLALMYEQLPSHSELSIWLRAFLDELREIMDTAYRVSVITRAYGRPPQLERLIDEVQEIESQVADQVARRLLARDADQHHEHLDGRLATLRLCASELAMSMTGR